MTVAVLDDQEHTRQPIALLLNILSGGGAQRRIATLANRFVELGRAVDVVSLEPGGPMTALLEPGVRVVTLLPAKALPILSNAIYARKLANYLDTIKPSVLMSCVTDVHLLAVVASRMQGRRVPLVLRASRHPYRILPRTKLIGRATEPVKLRKTAWCYGRADAIIALSMDAAHGLRRMLRDRPIRLETIRNPVIRSTLLDEPEQERRARSKAVPLILGVGRFVEQKDFGTLLRAFAILRTERDARLVLLGSGRQARYLRALAQRLGIDGDMQMPGDVDNVAEWMREADLVVSSSLWEGVQATLIEALAVGCPVVATDCPGGARETLDQGRLGSLVPVRDAGRMAAAMRDQLDHPPDPLHLAAGALPFGPAGKAERYLSLFDDCTWILREGGRF